MRKLIATLSLLATTGFFTSIQAAEVRVGRSLTGDTVTSVRLRDSEVSSMPSRELDTRTSLTGDTIHSVRVTDRDDSTAGSRRSALIGRSTTSRSSGTTASTTRNDVIRVGRTSNGTLSIVGRDSGGSASLSISPTVRRGELTPTSTLLAHATDTTVSGLSFRNAGSTTGNGMTDNGMNGNAGLIEGRDVGAPDPGATPTTGPGSPGWADISSVQDANRLAQFPDANMGAGGVVGATTSSNNLATSFNDAARQGSFQPSTSTGTNPGAMASNTTVNNLARSSILSRANAGTDVAGSNIPVQTSGTTGATNRASITSSSSMNGSGVTTTGVANFGNATSTTSIGAGTGGSTSTISGNGGAGSTGSNGINR